MEEIAAIGLDLAKSIFQVHGIAEDGHVVVRQALRRLQILEFSGSLEPCLVGLEACASAHLWANTTSRFGHMVRMIPPGIAKLFSGWLIEARWTVLRRPFPQRNHARGQSRQLWRVDKMWQ